MTRERAVIIANTLVTKGQSDYMYRLQVKCIADELQATYEKAYRQGFSDGVADGRSREFAMRHGHDMGQ